MWQLHPSQQQTRKQRESLSNKNRTLQESTWKGAPQVLHYTLPEPNKLDHLAFQPRAGENKVGMSNTREQGCWLIGVISKRTADHNGIQLRAFLLQMRNQDPERWSDFFLTVTQPGNLNSGFWVSFRVLFTSPFCLLCSVTHTKSVIFEIVSGFLLTYTEKIKNIFPEMFQTKFYYVLINLLTTQDSIKG